MVGDWHGCCPSISVSEKLRIDCSLEPVGKSARGVDLSDDYAHDGH
jgi:hypothetical protein